MNRLHPLLHHPVAPLDVGVLSGLARIDPLHGHIQTDQPQRQRRR